MSLWTAAVSPYGFCVITPLLDALGNAFLEHPYYAGDVTAIALGSIIASGFLSVSLPLIVFKFDLKLGGFYFYSLIILAFLAELCISPVFAQALFVYTLSIDSHLGRLFLGLVVFISIVFFISLSFSLIYYPTTILRWYHWFVDVVYDYLSRLSFSQVNRDANHQNNQSHTAASIAVPVLLSPYAQESLAMVTVVSPSVTVAQAQQQPDDDDRQRREYVYVVTDIIITEKVDGDDKV